MYQILQMRDMHTETDRHPQTDTQRHTYIETLQNNKPWICPPRWNIRKENLIKLLKTTALLLFFETGFHNLVQAVLHIMLLMTQFPKCWDFGHTATLPQRNNSFWDYGRCSVKDSGLEWWRWRRWMCGCPAYCFQTAPSPWSRTVVWNAAHWLRCLNTWSPAGGMCKALSSILIATE